MSFSMITIEYECFYKRKSPRSGEFMTKAGVLSEDYFLRQVCYPLLSRKLVIKIVQEFH